MESILALYKKELAKLYRISKHSSIDQLLKPIAFALARINYRLNDSYAELSERVLEILWPSIYRPIPSIGMVTFKGISERIIRQGTLLKAFCDSGRFYYFKTIYSFKLYPIYVKAIQFLNKKNNTSVLKIQCCFSRSTKSEKTLKGHLRFYINMNFKTACFLYELFFNQHYTVSIKIHNDVKTYNANEKIITEAGLNLDETLLFNLKHAISADQLVVDFFAYPKKFLFFDLNLSMFHISSPLTSDVFDILFYFSNSYIMLTQQIDEKSLLLNCTPIINLFDRPSEYIKLDHKQVDYKVRPQKIGKDDDVDIYDIKEVWRINSKGDAAKLLPFEGSFDAKFNESLRWAVRKRAFKKKDNQEIRLVFSGDHNVQNTSYIKANLLCSHKSIENKLSNMPIELANDKHLIENAKLLDELSPPFLFKPVEDKWRLIAFLSTATNQMLHGGDQISILKQLLLAIPIKQEFRRDFFLSRLLSFNIKKNHQLVSRKNIAYYIQGLNINMVFDDSNIRWSEFFLFWQVLKKFFSIKYSIYGPISFSLLGQSSQKEASSVVFPQC